MEGYMAVRQNYGTRFTELHNINRPEVVKLLPNQVTETHNASSQFQANFVDTANMHLLNKICTVQGSIIKLNGQHILY